MFIFASSTLTTAFFYDQRLPSPIFTRQAIVIVTFSKELPLCPFRIGALFLVVGET